MAKPKTVFSCESCGAQHLKWQGQCPDCGAWNTLAEQRSVSDRSRRAQYSGAVHVSDLQSLNLEKATRIETGIGEFDRVIGGGFVPGSVVLIGGDPGIGKSTLLLRVLAELSAKLPACYVTGEESLEQIGLRAERLGVGDATIQLLAETNVLRVRRTTRAAILDDAIRIDRRVVGTRREVAGL